MRALAIDGSEWFQDGAWQPFVAPRHWRRLPSRCAVALRSTAARLAEAQVQATFFVWPQLAMREPGFLRELVAAGHEVALLAAPHDVERAVALRDGRAALEAATGRVVHGARFLVCASDRSGEDGTRADAAKAGAAAAAAVRRAALAASGFAYDATGSGDDLDTAVHTLTGERAASCSCFAAWRLDGDTPPLAVPKALQRTHAAAVRDGAAALRDCLESAAGTIARAIGLLDQPAGAHVPSVVAHPPKPSADAVPLTIVVPLKDEADGVAALCSELDHVAKTLADVADCRFVIVDDGSTDGTFELLRQHALQRPSIRLERHLQNRGVAAAIRTGIQSAATELVASIDGDLSYDPLELRAMLPLAAHADVVTASPYHPRGGVRNVPPWRLALSRSLSFLYRRLLRREVHTWTSCFRLYRRSAVLELPLVHERFLGTAELLVRVLRRNGCVAEHPCVLEARLVGTSKMRVVRTVFGHLGLLWAVATGRIR